MRLFSPVGARMNGVTIGDLGLDNRVRKWIIQAGLYELVTSDDGEQVKEAPRFQQLGV